MLFSLFKISRFAAVAVLVLFSLQSLCIDAVPSHVHTRKGNPFGAIGFGTNGIYDEAVILDAIAVGYRFFDLAEDYNNVEMVAEAIEKSGVDRGEFFINMKLQPRIAEVFVERVNEIRKFFAGYLDCVMFHSMPDYTSKLEKILSALVPHKGDWFYYLGASNYEFVHEQKLAEAKAFGDALPEECKKAFQNNYYAELERRLACGKQFELVQNPHSHQKLDFQLHTYIAHKIMHIGFGVFGGRENSACGTLPSFNFSPISFPAINRISERLNVSPFQLILAYLSRDSFQIPSSTKKDRMIANLSMTPVILARLTEDDFSAIDDDVVHLDMKSVASLSQRGDWRNRIKGLYSSKASHRLLDHLFTDAELKPIFKSLLNASKLKILKDFIIFLESIGHHGRMNGSNDIEAQTMALKRIKSMYRKTPESNLYMFHDYLSKFNPSNFEELCSEYCAQLAMHDNIQNENCNSNDLN